MGRKHLIALFTNTVGSVGYTDVGMEPPEQLVFRLKGEGKRNIIIIETNLVYWSK